MEWHPIETAPVNLSVLVFDPERGRLAVTVGNLDCDCWSDELDEGMPIFPTHWMPMPTPPLSPPKLSQTASAINSLRVDDEISVAGVGRLRIIGAVVYDSRAKLEPPQT